MPISNLALRKIELIGIQAFAGSPFKTTNGTVTVISPHFKVSNTWQNTEEENLNCSVTFNGEKDLT